jgi:hypothetical protein
MFKHSLLVGLTALGLFLLGTPLIVASPPVKPKPSESECGGDYGTSVVFEDTPKDAARKADKEQKLVMILHVSGQFEDSGLT